MIRPLLLTLALASLASAQETLFRQVVDTKTDTHIEATALFSKPSLGGYHPVRIFIANNQKIPHKVTLSFKDATNYNEGLTTSSSFSFTAPANRSITADILVPLAPQNGNGNYHNLTINLSGTMGSAGTTSNSPFSPDHPAVLLSDSLYTPNGSALDSALSALGSSHYGRSTEFSTKFDPKQLPDDWRAFSGFDTIMLTDADWSEIPPGPRNAIISWLRLGGQLVVYSATDPTLASLGIPDDASFGQALVLAIGTDLKLEPKSTVGLATSRRSAKTRLDAITGDFNGSWPLQGLFGEKSFNYILFIIILLIFGVLVGPVNLFVFAKSGRRHRLFITTPIISLATSLILIALIILQDGFGGDGARIVLMEVRPDGNQNAAFIQQEQFSRTGVMTSPSFALDASALMVPVPIASSRWSRFTDSYDSSGAYDIQPSDGKLFASGGWFQSRSEQGQLVTAVVPTRGRIEATPQADTLISTFDFPIESLLYKDPSGQWHRADKVVKGQKTKLTPIDPTMVLPLLNKKGNLFTERNRAFLKKVQDRNDHFIAFTEDSPGIATHPGIDWKTTTVITGPIAR